MKELILQNIKTGQNEQTFLVKDESQELSIKNMWIRYFSPETHKIIEIERG